MTLSEEIQQLVESGASLEAVKSVLVEEKTKTLILERKQLLSWAVDKLKSLQSDLDKIVPDNQMYDVNGVLQESYSKTQFDKKTDLTKRIAAMEGALSVMDWVILKGLQDKYYKEASLVDKGSWGSIYSNKNGDYFLSADWSKLSLLNNACFTYDSFGKDK